VIEASKQCGRNRLMAVESSIAWSQFVMGAPADTLRLIAHPVTLPESEERGVLGTEYSVLSTPLVARGANRESTPTSAARLIAAIGPEGGFTDEEVAAAIAAGWQPLSLGPRILRTETAALVIAAKLLSG
jgi:16S rRNA (uracil1498-N3)-methyltransferase